MFSLADGYLHGSPTTISPHLETCERGPDAEVYLLPRIDSQRVVLVGQGQAGRRTGTAVERGVRPHPWVGGGSDKGHQLTGLEGGTVWDPSNTNTLVAVRSPSFHTLQSTLVEGAVELLLGQRREPGPAHHEPGVDGEADLHDLRVRMGRWGEARVIAPHS